jgi:hypothetical protein
MIHSRVNFPFRIETEVWEETHLGLPYYFFTEEKLRIENSERLRTQSGKGLYPLTSLHGVKTREKI